MTSECFGMFGGPSDKIDNLKWLFDFDNCLYILA